MAETDLALVVTEPTLSGMHDLLRVVGLTEHFRLSVAVMINKAGLNEKNGASIREFCAEWDAPILAELPFDEVVTHAIAAQVPLVEYSDGPVAEGVTSAWERLCG
jgi:MinD superfamily P-loop ATPase